MKLGFIRSIIRGKKTILFYIIKRFINVLKAFELVYLNNR